MIAIPDDRDQRSAGISRIGRPLDTARPEWSAVVTASHPSTLTAWSVTVTEGTLTTRIEAQADAICTTV